MALFGGMPTLSGMHVCVHIWLILACLERRGPIWEDTQHDNGPSWYRGDCHLHLSAFVFHVEV